MFASPTKYTPEMLSNESLDVIILDNIYIDWLIFRKAHTKLNMAHMSYFYIDFFILKSLVGFFI